jgi:hypothetical protein
LNNIKKDSPKIVFKKNLAETEYWLVTDVTLRLLSAGPSRDSHTKWLQEGHETSSSVPPLLKKTSGEREVRATNTITLRPLTNSHCSVAGDTAKNPRTSGRGKSICQAQNYHWGGTQALSYP